MKKGKWFEHLCRIYNVPIQKMVYDWELEGRIRRERQPMSWKYGLHQIMRNGDSTTEEGADRDRCRSVIGGRTI